MTQTYAYRTIYAIEEFTEYREQIIAQFRRDVLRASRGYPQPSADEQVEVTGLRDNTEGARNLRGMLINRIPCDLAHPRACEVELVMSWVW